MVVNVVCRVGHDTFPARSRDISGSGMFLETEWLFDPTQEIRMALEVPGKGTIAATGRPTRFEAGGGRGEYSVGVGVRFLESDR